MKKPTDKVLGVHMRDGLVYRVTSNDETLDDTPVVVFEPGFPDRAIFAAPGDAAELREAAAPAMDKLRCDGIGIALEGAAEKIRDLSVTSYRDPREYVRDVAAALDEMTAMIRAALRLDTSV